MKKLFAMILAGMMAVSMAACGGSSSNAPAADAAFKTVEDGKLHMATNAAFPPYEMTSDNGGYEGIDVEIATKIAEKLGLELVVDDMEFTSIIAAVQSGKSDMAMAGMTVTDERKETVDFSIPYYTATQVMIVKEDSDIDSFLSGKQMSFLSGKISGLDDFELICFLVVK